MKIQLFFVHFVSMILHGKTLFLQNILLERILYGIFSNIFFFIYRNLKWLSQCRMTYKLITCNRNLHVSFRFIFHGIQKMFRLVRRCLLIIVQTNHCIELICEQIEKVWIFKHRNQTKLTRMENNADRPLFRYRKKCLFYKRNVIYFNNGFEISNNV